MKNRLTLNNERVSDRAVVDMRELPFNVKWINMGKNVEITHDAPGTFYQAMIEIDFPMLQVYFLNLQMHHGAPKWSLNHKNISYYSN